MAIIDVVKCDIPDILVWKWYPQNGSPSKREQDLRWGTQLIVNHSQKAIFVKNGQIADVFEAGHHTLSTQNLPIISSIVGLPFGLETPFKAEVYFINETISMEIKFGLVPFNMIEPNFRVPIPITSRGSFVVRISDGEIFLNKLSGVTKIFEPNKLKDYFRGIITENVKFAITKIAKEQNISPLEFESMVMDVSEAVKGIISKTFNQYGIHLEFFNIEAIPIVDDNEQVKRILEDYQRLMSQDMEERMRLKRRAENLDMYRIDRSFDTVEKAAENIRGGETGILGTMVGLGIVQPLGQAMGNMMNNIVPNVQQPISINKDEVIKMLKDLSELKKAGVLTEEEFVEKKKELLSKI
jgi:membrane protease subunit (stomatin/prohibitin family)